MKRILYFICFTLLIPVYSIAQEEEYWVDINLTRDEEFFPHTPGTGAGLCVSEKFDVKAFILFPNTTEVANPNNPDEKFNRAARISANAQNYFEFPEYENIGTIKAYFFITVSDKESNIPVQYYDKNDGLWKDFSPAKNLYVGPKTVGNTAKYIELKINKSTPTKIRLGAARAVDQLPVANTLLYAIQITKYDGNGDDENGGTDDDSDIEWADYSENDFWANINFTRDSLLWGQGTTPPQPNSQLYDNLKFVNDNYTIHGQFGRFTENSRKKSIDSPGKTYKMSWRLSSNTNNQLVFPKYDNIGRFKISFMNSTYEFGGFINLQYNAAAEGQTPIWTDFNPKLKLPFLPDNEGENSYIIDTLLNLDATQLRIAPVFYPEAKGNNYLQVFEVSISKKDSEELPIVSDDRPIRLAVLPDTQTYTNEYPFIFHSQTAWIQKNAANIDFAIHVGDITNANNAVQWPRAANALALLEEDVPLSFVPGNHDTGGNNAQYRNTDGMNEALPYSKFSLKPNFGGTMETGRMENTYSYFSKDGYDFLIVAIEFAPRDTAINWAKKVIQAHPNHNVIINTHAYMYSDNKRMSDLYGHKWTPSTYGVYDESNGDANDGEQIWDKLVKLYPNIFMVLSGHVLNEGTGTLVSKGVNNNQVYQMLANYQKGVTGTINGGNGFLRLIDIDTKNNKINVQTYSTLINSYKTETNQKFSFENVELIKNSTKIKTLNAESNLILNQKNNQLNFINNSKEQILIEIFDIAGIKITSAIIDGSLTLDIRAKGSYIIRAYEGKKHFTKKIIIY
ncbi:MAG: metallophosphoesterase [Pigmentiphaga sp.]|nr:metallophosphoesterase [Pigmentiphaga sp.]